MVRGAGRGWVARPAFVSAYLQKLCLPTPALYEVLVQRDVCCSSYYVLFELVTAGQRFMLTFCVVIVLVFIMMS